MDPQSTQTQLHNNRLPCFEQHKEFRTFGPFLIEGTIHLQQKAIELTAELATNLQCGGDEASWHNTFRFAWRMCKSRKEFHRYLRQHQAKVEELAVRQWELTQQFGASRAQTITGCTCHISADLKGEKSLDLIQGEDAEALKMQVLHVFSTLGITRLDDSAYHRVWQSIAQTWGAQNVNRLRRDCIVGMQCNLDLLGAPAASAQAPAIVADPGPSRGAAQQAPSAALSLDDIDLEAFPAGFTELQQQQQQQHQPQQEQQQPKLPEPGTLPNLSMGFDTNIHPLFDMYDPSANSLWLTGESSSDPSLLARTGSGQVVNGWNPNF
ncbi:MAG: hypothetical protein Q9162_007138 [Coniocarpon cinnabarinum]